MATATPIVPPAAPRGADEAEQATKEFVAKKFNLHDPQILATTFDGTYFTVSVMRKAKYHHMVSTSGQEEAKEAKPHPPEASKEVDPRRPEASELDLKRGMRAALQTAVFYDVKVDKTGLVVGWARPIRTADEAEAIAKEYALERHELTHFLPYTTTFDGTYYTVYAGGLIYEGGVVKSALKIYKSKFYDVKVDKTGLVVAWTTEGLISHYSTKLQRFR